MNKIFAKLTVAAALTGLLACACTQKIAWDDDSGKPVIQGDTKSVSVAYTAGETVLNVTQTAGYDVRVSDDAREWLTAEGNGAELTLRYTENPGLVRSGQVILTKEDVMWIYTVQQELNPTSGPHDIALPFEEKGRVYGLIIYSLDPAELAKIPVGDFLIFDMTNNAGTLILYDGATNATLVEAAPVGGKVVIDWTEELKAVAALGCRVSTEENPVVAVHYTNIEGNLPKEIEVPFALLGEMGAMRVYGFDSGAFADVEEGMTVLFEFTTSEGSFMLLNSANAPITVCGIADNQVALVWNADMAAAAADGGRIIINEGNGNELVKIHAIEEGEGPSGSTEIVIDCPAPREGMPIQVYAFEAGAFDAVPEGWEVVFELENAEGSFNILDAVGTPVIGIQEMTENVYKVRWTAEIAEKVAGGARIVISTTDNWINRIYAHELEPVVIAFGDPMAYNGWNIYQFPEDAFADVQEGMTVTFTSESAVAGYNFLSAANVPVASGEFAEEASFSVEWTADVAEALAGGARLILTDESNHLVKIEAR